MLKYGKQIYTMHIISSHPTLSNWMRIVYSSFNVWLHWSFYFFVGVLLFMIFQSTHALPRTLPSLQMCHGKDLYCKPKTNISSSMRWLVDYRCQTPSLIGGSRKYYTCHNSHSYLRECICELNRSVLSPVFDTYRCQDRGCGTWNRYWIL
jgi:hypothetical protein